MTWKNGILFVCYCAYSYFSHKYIVLADVVYWSEFKLSPRLCTPYSYSQLIILHISVYGSFYVLLRLSVIDIIRAQGDIVREKKHPLQSDLTALPGVS